MLQSTHVDFHFIIRSNIMTPHYNLLLYKVNVCSFGLWCVWAMLFVNKRGTSPSIINIAMASMLYHRIWGSTSCTNKKNTTLSFVKGASLFIPLIKVSSGISVLVYSYFPYACGHFFFFHHFTARCWNCSGSGLQMSGLA